MRSRQPKSKRTDTRFPNTTLFRCGRRRAVRARGSRGDEDMGYKVVVVGATGAVGRKMLTTLAERDRSEEHTSELQSLMRISYAVFCLKKKYIILSLMMFILMYHFYSHFFVFFAITFTILLIF